MKIESNFSPEIEYRIIPSAPAYQAWSDGTVRRNGRLLKTPVDKFGYAKISLSLGKNGQYRHTQVHRVICESFHGPPPSEKHQVAHNNGDKLDNRPCNLRWATASENAEDRSLHGKWRPPRGSLHWNAVLDEDAVRCIRKRLAAGEKQFVIAKEFGISAPTLSEIKSGKSWVHVI